MDPVPDTPAPSPLPVRGLVAGSPLDARLRRRAYGGRRFGSRLDHSPAAWRRGLGRRRIRAVGGRVGSALALDSAGGRVGLGASSRRRSCIKGSLLYASLLRSLTCLGKWSRVFRLLGTSVRYNGGSVIPISEVTTVIEHEVIPKITSLPMYPTMVACVL